MQAARAAGGRPLGAAAAAAAASSGRSAVAAGRRCKSAVAAAAAASESIKNFKIYRWDPDEKVRDNIMLLRVYFLSDSSSSLIPSCPSRLPIVAELTYYCNTIIKIDRACQKHGSPCVQLADDG